VFNLLRVPVTRSTTLRISSNIIARKIASAFNDHLVKLSNATYLLNQMTPPAGRVQEEPDGSAVATGSQEAGADSFLAIGMYGVAYLSLSILFLLKFMKLTGGHQLAGDHGALRPQKHLQNEIT